MYATVTTKATMAIPAAFAIIAGAGNAEYLILRESKERRDLFEL